MDKSQVSSIYLDVQKDAHAGKRYRRISQRVALVVGAREGNIGHAIVDRLQDGGITVHTVDLIADGIDIASAEGLDVITKLQPDILVLANGSNYMEWIENMELANVEQVIHDTLTASIIATSWWAQQVMHDPWRKSLVFIGSMAHKAVLNGSSPYCAAKAGLNHFAECCGWELTPKGFTVHTVHPSNTFSRKDNRGNFYPHMTEATIRGLMEYRNLSRQAAEEYWGACNLMDRWLHPDDIAELIWFLITSESAMFMSGAALEMKAGQR